MAPSAAEIRPAPVARLNAPEMRTLCISDESLVEGWGMSSRAALCGCLLLACVAGCKKKSEEPPPLASAAPEATAVASAASPAPEPAPSAVAQATASAEPSPAGQAPAAESDAGKKSPPAGQSIKGCCAALAKAAQGDALHAPRYKAAAAVCAGLVKSVNSGAANLNSARTTLRAQLQGIPIPGGC